MQVMPTQRISLMRPTDRSAAARQSAKWTLRLRVKPGSHDSVILTLKKEYLLQFETTYFCIRHRIAKQKYHNVESASL